MTDKQELAAKAELLKALAHPTRLCIVKGLLEKGPQNVSQMQNCASLPQPSVSQHLAKLRSAGIVEGSRCGVEVVYKLVSEEAKQVLAALFAINFTR